MSTGAIPIGIAAAGQITSRSDRVVYRMATLVRLTIRLEDFSADSEAEIERESEPVKPHAAKAASAAANATALQAIRRASGEDDLQADASVITTKANAKASKSPPGGGNSGPPFNVPADDLVVELSIIPIETTISHNSFKIADKASFTVALSDFPILPDLIRSMLVEVFEGTTSASDFADPSRWIPKLLDRPPSFRGYAIEDNIEVSDSDLRVSVTARSLEARLMDKKINPLTKERRIRSGGEDTVDFVRRLISTVPEFSGSLGDPIGVRLWHVDAKDPPRLDAKLFNRSIQTAQSRAQAGGQVQSMAGAFTGGTDPAQDPSNGTPVLPLPAASPTAELSVWDVIIRACELSGVIPVYDPSIVAVDTNGRTIPIGANNILLIPPQTIYEAPDGGVSVAGGPIDGFHRDVTVGGLKRRTEVRLFVWGENISEMKLGRKYGHTKRPRVRVVCHNPDGGPGERTLTEFFPDTKRATSVSAQGIKTKGSAKGHAPIEEEIVRVVRGIRDRAQLKQIAVGLFHQIGKRELTCMISTDDAASHVDPDDPKRPNDDPDVLRLRSGTPCRVMVGRRVGPTTPDLIINGLSDLLDKRGSILASKRAFVDGPAGQALSQAGRAKLFEAIDKIDRAYQTAKLTDWYYCRCVEKKYGPDGFTAQIELTNFVIADLPNNLSAQDQKDVNRRKIKRPNAKTDARQAAIDDAVERMGL